MKIHRVDTFKAAESALRQSDLRQSLYDEGGILMDKVLVTLHGDEHPPVVISRAHLVWSSPRGRRRYFRRC